jgi:hypothetical protein
MATEDLGKLSPGDMRALGKVISDAKELPSQQTKIINAALAGETAIGELRISYLDQYFDKYSEVLDKVATKNRETLDSAFLILEKKLTSSYSKVTSDIKKIGQQLADLAIPGDTEQPASVQKKSKEATDTSADEHGQGKDTQKTQKDNVAITNAQALIDMTVGALIDAYKKENNARLKEISSGNSELLKLEREFQSQRIAQLKSHLEQLTRALSLSTVQTVIPEARVSSEALNVEEPLDTADAANALLNTNQLLSSFIATPKMPDTEGSSNNGSNHAGEMTEALREALTSYVLPSLPAEELAATDNDVTRSGSLGELLPTEGAIQPVENSVAEDSRGALLEIMTSELQAFLAQAAKQDNQLTQEPDIAARREELQLLENFARRREEINRSILDLELARSKTEEDILARSIEFRLDKLKEVTDVELQAQNQINKIDLQLANLPPAENLTEEQSEKWQAEQRAADLESAQLRSRQTNAEVDIKAYQEFEKQIADYRAKLDLDARSANNGILTAEQAAANEELVRKEFALRREELLAAIKAEQLEKSKLEQLRQEEPEMAMAFEKRKATFIANEEYKARKKNHGKLTEEERDRIKKLADEKYKLDETAQKRLEKERLKQLKEEHKERAKAGDRAIADAVTGSLSKENSIKDRIQQLVNTVADTGNGSVAKTIGASLITATKTLSTMAQQLESSIDQIALYKGNIDTRLQGSSNEKFAGSYWGKLNQDMMSVGAVTPYFKQEDFANNIKALVERGISFDLSQRAFLMTIQEKIANTFNVADGTLLRLIRLQQEDSTAGRLGMESALNTFLNEMYETSEYLTDVAASVRSSLEEMESLMSGAAATEVEYQVQKWMGSLYSVGMSQTAVTSISNALGQIASGQVDALTSGGAGNLLVMAANNAGIPIADILTNGLDAKETNQLLQATVNYLAEIAESSKDNNVVQQQLADVFGVKASDLRAATNLAQKGTTGVIFGESLTYDNMLNQLFKMAGSMASRTSLGEMMSNVWANGQYTLASSMSSNPVSYLTYKMATLLDNTAGGIAIPAISVLGNMVDLETTVADLMRVASVGTGILGSLGPMISGLASSFSGQAMLSTMGIKQGSGLKVNLRGDGVSALEGSVGGGQQTTSGSGYVGNASGSDVKNATIQEAEDSKKQQMIEAKEEEPVNQIDMINASVLNISEILEEVTRGNRSFRVRIDGYGLTSINKSGAQGGVNGLLNNGNGNAANGFGGTSSTEGYNGALTSGGSFSSGAQGGSGSGLGLGASSGNFGGANGGTASGSYGGGNGMSTGGSAIDLGGWTMM